LLLVRPELQVGLDVRDCGNDLRWERDAEPDRLLVALVDGLLRLKLVERLPELRETEPRSGALGWLRRSNRFHPLDRDGLLVPRPVLDGTTEPVFDRLRVGCPKRSHPPLLPVVAREVLLGTDCEVPRTVRLLVRLGVCVLVAVGRDGWPKLCHPPAEDRVGLPADPRVALLRVARLERAGSEVRRQPELAGARAAGCDILDRAPFVSALFTRPVAAPDAARLARVDSEVR